VHLKPAHGLDEGEARPHRPLGVVLMRLRPAEIGEHAVAHELGDVALEAQGLAGHGILVETNGRAHLLGMSAADNAVEPTRSTNITVSCRRSPSASRAVGGASTGALGPVFGVKAGAASAAIASRSLRRCPTMLTPMSLRSSTVSLGRMSATISFSWNACA